ncbi:hypothetical protein Acsp05_49130 [Actinokineospora sp. NBRC 105648]|nr:hypothetical protein Acsp05_49130 [Actinokineospora sp. NBRC 105648]
MPDTAVTLALTALVAWAGTALADRRGGLVATLALLGVSQLSLHVLLTDITDPHAGHLHAAGVSDSLMVTTHVVATVLSAVLLTGASQALTAIAAALAGLVRAIAITAPPIAPAPAATTAPIAVAPGHLLTVVLRVVCGRRGPPLPS